MAADQEIRLNDQEFWYLDLQPCPYLGSFPELPALGDVPSPKQTDIDTAFL
jgi:hypothetical protein